MRKGKRSRLRRERGGERGLVGKGRGTAERRRGEQEEGGEDEGGEEEGEEEEG